MLNRLKLSLILALLLSGVVAAQGLSDSLVLNVNNLQSVDTARTTLLRNITTASTNNTHRNARVCITQVLPVRNGGYPIEDLKIILEVIGTSTHLVELNSSEVYIVDCPRDGRLVLRVQASGIGTVTVKYKVW